MNSASIERLRRVEERVVGARFADALRERARMLGDDLLVLLAKILGDDGHLLARLHVDEVRRVGEREVDLVAVEQMEDHHVVAAAANVRERVDDGVRILIEIGDEQDETAAAHGLRQLPQRREQRRLARRGLRVAPCLLDAIERVQNELQMLRRRRHVVDDVGVDRREADAIALHAREVRRATPRDSSRTSTSRRARVSAFAP